MDERVIRAMARWPNVPSVHGWLRLDARGYWWIRESRVEDRAWIDYIGRNYAGDESGGWYFQNGPQRVWVTLDALPLILRAQPDGVLVDHTGTALTDLQAVWLDDASRVLLMTDRGPGLLDHGDLDWVLRRLHAGDRDLDIALEEAMATQPGNPTGLFLGLDGRRLPVGRIADEALESTLGFVADPSPEAAPSNRSP